MEILDSIERCRRALLAQTPGKPFQSQASSTIQYAVKNSEETVEIHNVSYEIAGDSAAGWCCERPLIGNRPG